MHANEFYSVKQKRFQFEKSNINRGHRFKLKKIFAKPQQDNTSSLEIRVVGMCNIIYHVQWYRDTNIKLF